MSFTLEIEFSGLCMYLHDTEANIMGIVLPDARTTADPTHADDSQGIPHVGYIRFDLADLREGAPVGDPLYGPRYEVVHRFNCEELDLGLSADEPLLNPKIEMPVIKSFAPYLKPVPGLFTASPPNGIVMRTILSGGTLGSIPFPDRWKFPTTLNGGDTSVPYTGQFAGFSTWRRVVEDQTHLTLRFRQWDGTVIDSFNLYPSGPDETIRLKIANLCADNPMEWPQLNERRLANGVFLDDDFKWFYRLLQPETGDLRTALKSRDSLPVPELDEKRMRPLGETPPDCTGATADYSIQRDGVLTP